MVSLSRSLSSQSIFQDRQSKALASQADPLKVQHIETINKLGLFATAPKQTTAVLVPATQTQVVAQQPQAEQELPEVVPQPRAHIAEDSIWRKLLTCVPIVGLYTFASQADPLKVQHIETINKLGLFATAPKQTTAVLVPATQTQVVAQQPQAEQELPEVVPQPRAHIAEDSTWRKLLTCVPIVGLYTFYKNDYSLIDKINKSQNLAEQANYVRIKNHYLVADIARVLLHTVIIISVVALTILAPPVGIGLGVLGAAIIGLQTAGGAFGIAYNSYTIYKNQQFIKHVQDGTPLTDRTIRLSIM